MKKGIFLGFLLIIPTLFTSLLAGELKGVNFSQKGEVSEIEFLFDFNDIKVNKFQIKDDKQLFLDISDVTAVEKVMRGFDASEFPGAVVFVKAYKKPKTEKDIRVAIQLRDNVRSNIIKKTNRIVLQIENRYGVFSQGKVEEGQSISEKVSELGNNEKNRLNIPKSDSVEDILENITLSGRKKYIGKRITMNLKSISPEDILKMIAETSGFNIIMTEDLKKLPPLSLNLNDIPWDQALDMVLDMSKLVAKKSGVILIVQGQETFAREMQIAKQAKDAAKEQEPILTRVFPISFANLDEITKILGEYSTPTRGKISKDSRTNALIVKDTADIIERMKKIVELLDTQTPQVLIESKIVEVFERYTKNFGLANGFGWGYDPFSRGTGNSGNFSFSSSSGIGDTTTGIFGLNIGRLNRVTNLNFQLNLMESESKGKIISSPKVITKNNVPASIKQNESTYYPEITTVASAVGQPTQTKTWKSQTANLDLNVTPQVTNDGSISLDVTVSKDSLATTVDPTAPRDEVKRSIKTQVLVDNGSTVVIGGIYSYVTSESHRGVPYLKDLPLLGWLFRTAYNPDTQKKELIIFITPRIINQEEAGLINKG